MIDSAIRILREPLAHFILLGAAIFAIAHHVEGRSQSIRIVITQEQMQRRLDNYLLQYGEPPSTQQIKAIEDQWILDEMFYREAVKIGLDTNDEIIRRRLIQKYEFLQQDLMIPEEPTESTLRNYYRRHLDRYRQPRSVTFSHVYFSPDGRGDNQAYAAARSAIALMNERNGSDAAELGDRFPGQSDFRATSQEQLQNIFGRQGLSDQIFDADIGAWAGPFRSGLGWHAVRMTERTMPRQIPFDEARERVRQDYLEAQRERRNANTIAKLRQNFEIIRK